MQDLAELLAKYRAKGRVTVVQISRAYCSDSKHWVSRISSTMSAIRKGQWGQYE